MVEDISEDAIREEAANLGRQKKALEEKLAGLRLKAAPAFEFEDMDHLKRVCAAIEAWLAEPADEQWSLVFEALQVSVEATREQATVHGVLPYEAPKFVTIEQTSA